MNEKKQEEGIQFHLWASPPKLWHSVYACIAPSVRELLLLNAIKLLVGMESHELLSSLEEQTAGDRAEQMLQKLHALYHLVESENKQIDIATTEQPNCEVPS